MEYFSTCSKNLAKTDWSSVECFSSEFNLWSEIVSFVAFSSGMIVVSLWTYWDSDVILLNIGLFDSVAFVVEIESLLL